MNFFALALCCFLSSVILVIANTNLKTLQRQVSLATDGHTTSQQHAKPPMHPKKTEDKHSLRSRIHDSIENIGHKFKHLEEKLHNFWHGLPNQIGYAAVSHLIKKQFESIRQHILKIKESHHSQHRVRRQALKEDDLTRIENIFNNLEQNTNSLENAVEELKDSDPSILVREEVTNKTNSGVVINNKRLSVNELLSQLAQAYNDLEHQNGKLQHKFEKLQKTGLVSQEEQPNHHTAKTAEPTEDEEEIEVSTETLQTTITNFKPNSGVDTTTQVLSVGQLLAELGGVNVAEIQDQAKHYFMTGINVVEFKIEATMKKEEQIIEHTSQSRTKHAIAVVLHAILHFADVVAKPVVVLALVALVGGCIAGVLMLPIITPVLMPIMQTLIQLISTLTRQLLAEWTHHSKNKALESS